MKAASKILTIATMVLAIIMIIGGIARYITYQLYIVNAWISDNIIRQAIKKGISNGGKKESFEKQKAAYEKIQEFNACFRSILFRRYISFTAFSDAALGLILLVGVLGTKKKRRWALRLVLVALSLICIFSILEFYLIRGIYLPTLKHATEILQSTAIVKAPGILLQVPGSMGVVAGNIFNFTISLLMLFLFCGMRSLGEK